MGTHPQGWLGRAPRHVNPDGQAEVILVQVAPGLAPGFTWVPHEEVCADAGRDNIVKITGVAHATVPARLMKSRRSTGLPFPISAKLLTAFSRLPVPAKAMALSP